MSLDTRYWPKLAREQFKETSPAAIQYNCLAWAVGETHRWWGTSEEYFWPVAYPGECEGTDIPLTVAQAAFAHLGFERCDSATLEDGVEKIALYESRGTFSHVARQLATGRWTSKLGAWEDIEHQTPESLVGWHYGEVAVVMRRSQVTR